MKSNLFFLVLALLYCLGLGIWEHTSYPVLADIMFVCVGVNLRGIILEIWEG